MTTVNRDQDRKLTRISGPIITAKGMGMAQMYEVVQVGDLGLVGEVVRVVGDLATIQVYEDTTMLKPGAHRWYAQALPFGLARPRASSATFTTAYSVLFPASRQKAAHGSAAVKKSMLSTWRKDGPLNRSSVRELVSGGQIIGQVAETPLVMHRIMVPPGISGTDPVDRCKGGLHPCGSCRRHRDLEAGRRDIMMMQRWPVRVPRPIHERLRITEPLITGQRIIDTFFPIGKGGAAAIPGGFGTGKTITQHQLAKWSDAEIIVFIGCGERGNEMTEVLREFPELKDPRSGRPLMERTILIANTSNMPVAAREVSIYTGITLAEYYRDMGLSCCCLCGFHEPLGGGPARACRAPRRDAGRGRVPGLAADAACPVLRTGRRGDDACRRPRLGKHRRGGKSSRRRFLGARHPAHPPVHPLFLGP